MEPNPLSLNSSEIWAHLPRRNKVAPAEIVYENHQRVGHNGGRAALSKGFKSLNADALRVTVLHGMHPGEILIQLWLPSVHCRFAGTRACVFVCIRRFRGGARLQTEWGGGGGGMGRGRAPLISYMLSTSRVYKDSEANPPVLPLKSPLSACVSSGNRIKMHTHVPLHGTREEGVQPEPASQIASSCVCRERGCDPNFESGPCILITSKH